MKSYSKFIMFFISVFLLFVIVRITEPKGIDWSLSFSNDDKIPYGSYVLYKLLPELFPKSKIQTSPYPVYNKLKGKHFNNSNYIFINNTFSPDELDTGELLKYVKEGNNVFISANFIRGKLSDTLKIITGLSYIGDDSLIINFSNNELKNSTPYFYKNLNMDYYYSELDSNNSTILGYNKENKSNFVKIKFGKGYFYFNTVPIAFTNYNILDSVNSSYIFKSLSYLPEDGLVLWDEYYKTGKASVKTPLRFILSSSPLSWAYYILIFSIFLYLIFEGKRKQRIIPEIKPVQNTTIEFAAIIGKLYYQQKDHKNAALKKISYFLDQVRNRYYTKADETDEDTIEKISKRSGVQLKEIRSIFNYINYIQIQSKISDKELKHINSLIESFYKKTGLYGRTN